MWNYIKIYELQVCFFIFITIFLSKRTECFSSNADIAGKSLNANGAPWWSWAVLGKAFAASPPLVLSSVCRCSAGSWGIPKTAVSMAMDVRQAELWLLLWACDFPRWTWESNPGASVGSTVWNSPQSMHGAADLCSLPHSHRGPMTFQILLWVFDMAAEGFRSTQNQFISHFPKALGSLSTTTVTEGLNSTTEYRNSNSN